MTEEQEKIFEELDEMLAEHERYKEEYGKKYAGLSEEEKMKFQLQELEEVEKIITMMGMKVERIDMDNKGD